MTTHDSHDEPRPLTPAAPLRVLELSGTAAGGVRAHLADCARVLLGAGHEVIVAAPEAVTAGARLGGARTEPLDIGARPGPGDLGVLGRIRFLARRADVVHAHGLRAGALAGLALGRRRPSRARLVVTEHNLPVGGRVTTGVGGALEALVASRADLVLAVSPDLAERARERGAAQVELAVIPAPRDQAVATAPAPSSVESAWHGAEHKVLTVARLAPQKGLDTLLDAAAALASRLEVDGCRLVWAVAGDGPLHQALAERVRAEGLPVRLLGRREDVAVLMGAADVVVQTSHWEGQPLTVQEALRAGAALVATDVGGTAVTAGGGAVLVEPSAEALAAAVGDLLTDDGARDAARRRAREAADALPGEAELAAQLERVLRPA